MGEKVEYDLQDTNGEIVGVIKLQKLCTLANVRAQVERYDILDYPFEFISERGHPIKLGQEHIWEVEKAVIGVKRKFTELGEEHMNREIKQKIGPTENDKNEVPNTTIQEIISSEGSIAYPNVNEHPHSIKAQSMIESKIKDLWNSKFLELQKTLPTESMSLRFSLEGDKPMIKIHCDGCNVDYGSGDILKAIDTIRNFRRSHIASVRHKKSNSHNSSQNIPSEKDVQDVQESPEPSDYHKILEAINMFNEFIKKDIDSPFKLVEPTIRDKKDKGFAKVECKKCNRWFALIPKTGNIVTSLSEHIKSKSHNQTSTSQTVIRTNEVGRPKKAPNDGKQQSLSKFLVPISRNLGEGSTSTGTSTPGQMRRG